MGDILPGPQWVKWRSMSHASMLRSAAPLLGSLHFHINFSKQTVKMRYNNRKPWLTQGLKDSIKVKNKLYNECLKVETVANEATYKTYRNKLHHIIKIAEKQHYSELLINCQNDVNKTWKIIDSIVNKSKTGQLQTKFKLNDGNFTTDRSVISNTFNDFFFNISPNLAGKIPNMGVSPVDYMGQPLVNSIFQSEVTTNEIGQFWGSLKNAAAGHEEINACLLRLVSPFIAEPPMYLCNHSLSESLFPTELKLANVIP